MGLRGSSGGGSADGAPVSQTFTTNLRNIGANRWIAVDSNMDQSVENRLRTKLKRGGTLKRLSARTRTNVHTIGMDVILVVNSVQTALKVSLGALFVGEVEDLVNEIIVNDGDLISYFADGLAGTGNAEIEYICMEFAP